MTISSPEPSARQGITSRRVRVYIRPDSSVMQQNLPSLRLVACLLNISEARNKTLVESVARAALDITCKSKDSNVKCPATVLNIFSDYDYNRSVITIAAPVENIEESVYKACEVAYEKIDLSKHSGGHPRLGAVDLVPIHPISGGVSLEQCGTKALSIAGRIVRHIKGASVFLFGHADKPSKRGLVERRKAVKWYEGKQGVNFESVGWDLGPAPSSRYGCTGVGAIPYVTNCNVTIDCNDLELGKAFAKAIRATSPAGLRGVQSMAFAHEGRVEIACNVQAFEDLTADGQFQYTSANEIEQRLRTLAETKGIQTYSTKLVGFTPDEAYDRAARALSAGNATAWITSTDYRM